MGELLYGSDKILKFKEILNKAKKFVYIGTTWMTPAIARIFVELCYAEKRVVILGDRQPYNIKSCEILEEQNVEVFLDVEGFSAHYKYLISETEFISGSQNFTGKGFFKQKNVFEYRCLIKEPLEYNQFLTLHTMALRDSIPFNTESTVKSNKQDSKIIQQALKHILS